MGTFRTTMLIAAIIYGILTSFVVTFQFALAFGAPWGEYTMGGKYTGALPTKIRIAVVVQALLLTLVACCLLSKAAVFPSFGFAVTGSWIAVGLSATATLLNLITPSKKERMIWAPVALGMLICSLIVTIT